MIQIKISPALTEEQRQDPRTKKQLEHATAYFNSPEFEKYKMLLALHETGHVIYARQAGATDVRLFGPTLYWGLCPGCADCDGNAPGISKSSTKWTIPAGWTVIARLKADVGGIVFREVLTGTPNDESAISTDMEGAWKWYRDNACGDEKAFQRDVDVAKAGIRKDLRSPVFRKLAWDTAREVEKALFPSQD